MRGRKKKGMWGKILHTISTGSNEAAGGCDVAEGGCVTVNESSLSTSLVGVPVFVSRALAERSL